MQNCVFFKKSVILRQLREVPSDEVGLALCTACAKVLPNNIWRN